MPTAEVAQLLTPGGGIDQPACPLIDGLLARLAGPMHGPRRNEERADGLSELFLLLQGLSRRAGEAHFNAGYLAIAADHRRVERTRAETGRIRCGSCRWYGRSSHLCLRQGAPYAAELPPATNPLRLDPPCREFESIRSGQGDASDVPDERRGATLAERIERALESLRRLDPGSAALILLHHLEGLSLRALARRYRCDRRHLSRELRRAEERLGHILEDLA